jgi:hypothetical protein
VRTQEFEKVMIFSNSTTVINRVQSTEAGLGESINIRTVKADNKLFGKGIQVGAVP